MITLCADDNIFGHVQGLIGAKKNITSVHGVTIVTDLVRVVSGLYYCSSNSFQGSSVCCLRDQSNETLSVFTVSGNQL